MNPISSQPHRRYNPLTGEWVLVSPHRLDRPWQGKTEATDKNLDRPAYDEKCYLCPGNKRAGDHTTPPYENVFVFDNDFPALLPQSENFMVAEENLLIARSERGICRVICYSPNHGKTMAQLTADELKNVINVWREQYLELGALPFINHVQIFENKGELMGCSNPHPHGQIWATECIPFETELELLFQHEYFNRTGKTLLQDYAQLELKKNERVVYKNDNWLAVVPYWAKWPFEIMLIPFRPVQHMGNLTDAEQNDLADILQNITVRYDNLFEVSFPYTMGFHQAPTNGLPAPNVHMHAHFYPPLLRSATVRKFMVGYEMLANPQRDITPESAAERLRELSDIHYSQR